MKICDRYALHCDANEAVNKARTFLLKFDKSANNADIKSGGFAAVASDYIDVYKKFEYYGGKYNRREMLDVVLVDGAARGIVCRNLITGELEQYSAHAVVLATGGYGNVYFLSTNAMASNVTAAFRAYKRGAGFANPCFVQIHPTCIPVHGEYQSKLNTT